MKPELKEKIIEFNKKRKENADKASDADVLIGALLKVPYGQLKKILDDDNVVAVLKKYGYDAEEERI